jgi:CitMHS family citrate-Mg2+:H+ or citrate-Ca2+:H+ symporter
LSATLLHPAMLGTAMVVTFMTLIMTKRMSIAFGLIAGAGAGLGDRMLEGVAKVTPTALMLCFAVLYFAIVMDTGLFDPLGSDAHDE